MKLQYNNLEELDLGAVETAITNAVEKPITFLDNFDATNIQETSASNTRLVGYDWNNGGQVIVRGNHFLDDSPLVTITSIEFSNSTTASLKITGNVSFNYNNGLYSGYYSSFSYQSNTGNLTVEYTGRLNVDRNTADVTGGTTTLIKVINDDFSYSLKGSMSVNANMDITGGTVTDFSLSDANGNALSFSGMSLNALTFEQLSDFQANSDLSNLLNYISSNLTGDFSIEAGSGDQTLTGNVGNNILDGGAGADTLIGGKGNDTYIVDNENDVVEEALNAGIDLVKASSNFTLSDNVENLTLTDGSANGGTNPLEGTGNALANTITGNAGNNILDGGAGVDKLIGGNGNDTYIVDMVRTGTTLANYKVALQDTITEAANAGTDTVQLRLQDGAVQMNNATTLTLAANLENLDASLTEDTKLNLTGNALANTLTGNDADNILDGGAGVDSLIGGLGDDTYILDLKVSGTGASANVSTFDDSIEETNGSNNGSDTIKLRGAATLTSATELTLDGDWIDIENLDASATGKTKLNLTGNSLNNILTGNAAANVLKGLGGDDTYVVNNIDDTVVEQNNEGTDLVQASITYTLGLNVENLELLGTTAINGNGNSLANTITGNAGNNILDGKGGNDILIGAKGNDTYVIDNSGVTVTEQTNEGIDQVNASVNYTLATNVENLLLTGSGDIIGTGNELANTITGNAGNNILDGGAGVDKLIGGNGNDTYIVDMVRTGTTLANYKVALQDTITEAANAGTDTVQLRLQDGAVQMNNATTLTLAANLENLDASLTEDTKLNLTGNALANTLTGNDADNILDGGAGNDILTGGKGNDTLKGGLGADVLKWGADDLGSAGDISNSTDTIIDFSVTQGDQLDLRDLLDGESSANILDY